MRAGRAVVTSFALCCALFLGSGAGLEAAEARPMSAASESSEAAYRPPVPLPGRPDMNPPPIDPSRAPVILKNQPRSQCVTYARLVSGIQIFGDAATWWERSSGAYERSSQPAEGAVLVLRGWNSDRRGHVAVVTMKSADRIIEISHANWMHGGEVSLNVPVMDVSPANDWSEVRVWNIRGGYWGARTYRVAGFIYPQAPAAGAGVSPGDPADAPEGDIGR